MAKVNVSGIPNAELAGECASAVAACGAANSCFTPRGVLVSEKCVESISRQILKDRCLAQGFGLSDVKG